MTTTVGAIPSTEAPARTRLHISPFNPSLADRYLGPSIRELAANISFHTVQTDPDRGFGYVDLPAMEAEKLKRKLNGAVLKGAKVKIEEARPEKGKKRKQDDLDAGDDVAEEKRTNKVAKKDRKKDKKKTRDVVPGHELPEGRHVKRGWEDKGASKRVAKTREKKTKKVQDPGKTIKDKEMRFRTVVPPNATPLATEQKTKSKAKSKEKQHNGKKLSVVKEFEYARKPSTAANAVSSSQSVEYEDGKGWIDGSGQIVEQELESIKKRRKSAVVASSDLSQTSRQQHAKQSQLDEESESTSAASSEVSSVVSSSDSDESGSEVDNDEEVGGEENVGLGDKTETSDETQAPQTELEDETATPPAVHPLEALFKRPAPVAGTTPSNTKSKPAPIDTTFSFFASGDDTLEHDGPRQDIDATKRVPLDDSMVLAMPQTPHTRRDLEWRTLRSGAPTPDTAAIGKRFKFSVDDDDNQQGLSDVDVDDDEIDESTLTVVSRGREREASDEADDASMTDQVAEGGEEDGRPRDESAFRKWFFENRGELNRSWKKRRREERKVKRQRENRKLSRKIA